ncbi:hypothetical protein [Salinibacterium sp. ZJ454]|uniref:YncE family protein n=1 Tax=Salinibacterium sp. ZJ454 TaxID=2708339 RepID=UPI00141E3461|nr:hypothetical protein [Salinibacterium sp. ZJ454]
MSPSSDSIIAIATVAGFVEFLDGDTYASIGRLTGLVEQPHEMAWDAGRRRLYITHTYRRGGYGEAQEKAHEISVLDPDGIDVEAVIDISPFRAPHDIAFDDVRDLIYVGVERIDGRNGIVVIDAATRTVIDSIPLEADNAHWISLSPDRSRCYVSHKESEQLSVVDLERRVVIAQIPCPGGAEEIDCDPSGNFAYVATPVMNVTNNVSQGALNRNPVAPGDPTPRLLKIDTVTNTVVDALDFDDIICAIVVTPSGDILASEMRFPDPDAQQAGFVPGAVHIVDGATFSRRGVVVTDELPFTLRCSPDGARAIVANLKTGTAQVIDLAGAIEIARINHNVGQGFGGTHGLSWIPGRAA